MKTETIKKIIEYFTENEDTLCSEHPKKPIRHEKLPKRQKSTFPYFYLL